MQQSEYYKSLDKRATDLMQDKTRIIELLIICDKFAALFHTINQESSQLSKAGDLCIDQTQKTHL